ncbi:MAG: recombinase family protein [Bacilli bacterium]
MQRTDTKLRAVAYPRYSSDNQRVESISAQIKAIEEYCTRKGYVFIGSYPDEAKSATTDNRPNFQRMMSDSGKGLFDVVVVHKLDRFARERYDSAYYKRLLRKNGVKLESVLEQFDDSPESVILESVLEGMAEYYSKNLAREARKGMIENAGRGIHAGGRPPYGYTLNPDTRKLEIDERDAKAVVIYFEGIVGGKSLAQIADRLNELGYSTQRGKKFTKNSFDGWARNRKYIGDYTWDVASSKDQDGKRNSHKEKPTERQIVIPGIVPAIVPVELWEKANAIMGERKLKPGQMKAKQIYLLTGKVICGNPTCGQDYRASSYLSKGKHYAYYKCNGNCGNRQVRKAELEDEVIRTLLNTCFTDEAIQETTNVVKEMYQEQRKSESNDIEPLKIELAELRRRIDNWLDVLGNGVKSVLSKIIDAEQQVTILESELARKKMMSETTDIDSERILVILRQQKDLLLSSDEEQKKQIIHAYVDRIVVLRSSDNNDDIHIDLKVRLFNGGGDPWQDKTTAGNNISFAVTPHVHGFRGDVIVVEL